MSAELKAIQVMSSIFDFVEKLTHYMHSSNGVCIALLIRLAIYTLDTHNIENHVCAISD